MIASRITAYQRKGAVITGFLAQYSGKEIDPAKRLRVVQHASIVQNVLVSCNVLLSRFLCSKYNRNCFIKTQWYDQNLLKCTKKNMCAVNDVRIFKRHYTGRTVINSFVSGIRNGHYKATHIYTDKLNPQIVKNSADNFLNSQPMKEEMQKLMQEEFEKGLQERITSTSEDSNSTNEKSEGSGIIDSEIPQEIIDMVQSKGFDIEFLTKILVLGLVTAAVYLFYLFVKLLLRYVYVLLIVKRKQKKESLATAKSNK